MNAKHELSSIEDPTYLHTLMFMVIFNLHWKAIIIYIVSSIKKRQKKTTKICLEFSPKERDIQSKAFYVDQKKYQLLERNQKMAKI